MKFTTINLAQPLRAEFNLINEAIDLWYTTYLPIVGPSLEIDGFQRAKSLCVLQQDNKIIAMATANHLFCELNKTTEHSYFKRCPISLKEELKANESKIMTVEWLTVHPDFQKRFSKIQYVDLIMGLMIFHMKHSGFDAAMGFSRIDQGANKIAKKFGAVSKGTIEMFGIECEIIFVPSKLVTPHSYLKTQQLIESLYFNQIQQPIQKENVI